jgi:PAS domain S-box-containing protein
LKIQDILKSDLLPVLTGSYENPHFVVDIRGNIFFYNKPAQELFTLKTSNNNIFDILPPAPAELFYSILKGKHKENGEPLVLQLTLDNGESRTLQMRYTSISEGDDNYFSFTFSTEKLIFAFEPEIKLETQKDIPVSKDILDLIKRNFPFTMMGKDLVRKKIDELIEFFWIKDTLGKYILVNRSFSQFLGIHYSKIEGNDEDKFIPGYLKKIVSTTEDFIMNSGKGVKLTGILYGSQAANSERIEFPLLNSEGKVYAIAGITSTPKELEAAENGDLIEYLPRPAALLNSSGNIIKCSDEFRLLFNIDKKNRNISYEKLFPSEVSVFVEGFLKTNINEELRSFTGNDFIRKVFASGYSVFLKRGDKNKSSHVLLFIDELKTTQNMQEVANFKGKVFDILIQNNPEPVFLYEKENLRFLEVNQSALTLYGYTRNEFLQMDLTDLYAPEDIQTLLGALNKSITEGVFTGPFRQKRKDGSLIHVEISKFTIKHNNKDAHYNIIRDVTKKLESEKEVQLFRSTFDNTDQLVFVTDSSGFIRFVNNAVLNQLGYKKNNLEKTSFAALVKDEERGNINTGLFRSTSREIKKLTTDLKNDKGDFVAVELTAAPILDFKKDVDAYTILGSIKKSNDVKEITKEIIVERIMPAEDKAHGDNSVLFSSIFHEILTPINVILGFVQEITESIDVLTPEQKEAAEIINQNRMSLLNTMNSVVEYYNIEKKTPDLTLNKVTAREIFDNLQNEFRDLNRSRGIEIGYAKVVSSFYFETDKGKFSNLIFLLTKIAGYLNKEKRIYISLYPVESNKFALTFKNRNEKITPNYMEELVHVFSQWGVTKDESGIPKLSLKLASRLISLFSGDLYVKEDNSEVGFTFPINPAPAEIKRITKPKTDEDLPPLVIKKPTPIPQRKATWRETHLNLAQLKCLYIEDQVDSQILFKVQMKELGNVQFAVSFEEALPLLDKTNFDFIVMDINLEGEYNGLDALRIIQKMPEYRSIPVIAVTAYLLPGDREKFISAGFNEFVPKPIFRDKMIDAMERVIKRK